MPLFHAETIVSTYSSFEIVHLTKKNEVEDEKFGSLDKLQFGTCTCTHMYFGIVVCDFEGLGRYRTLEYEGHVPTNPYNFF